MFIKSVSIINFRLFKASETFIVNDINMPDMAKKGTGLTVFVGENGCGKTSLLDAISLPLLNYKGENFSIQDLETPAEKVSIEILANRDFEVMGTMPKSNS